MALPLLLPASCGPGLPSEVPLGGTETSESDAPGGSSRAPGAARAEASSEFEGEGGDDGDGDKENAESDDTIVVAAESSAAPAPDQKKDEKKKAAAAPAADAAASAKPCDDMGGPEPACGPLHGGTCGSGYGPLCEQLNEALKPKIATAVVECMAENNRRSHCEAIDDCLRGGLEQACVTPADSEVCEKWNKRCDAPAEGPWQDVGLCTRGLASLKPKARAKVVECLENDCQVEACFLKAST